MAVCQPTAASEGKRAVGPPPPGPGGGGGRAGRRELDPVGAQAPRPRPHHLPVGAGELPLDQLHAAARAHDARGRRDRRDRHRPEDVHRHAPHAASVGLAAALQLARQQRGRRPGVLAALVPRPAGQLRRDEALAVGDVEGVRHRRAQSAASASGPTSPGRPYPLRARVRSSSASSIRSTVSTPARPSRASPHR